MIKNKLVWHPVGQSTGADVCLEPGKAYLVTLTNGEVDIDEFDLDGDYDWFWYDFERIRAWMEFPLREADEPNSFWHSVKDALPKRSGPYLVFFTNGTYRVEDFLSNRNLSEPFRQIQLHGPNFQSRTRRSHESKWT